MRSNRELERDQLLLLAARFFRSVAQGVLAADFALYLRASGWSGAHIGSVLAAGLALAVVLTLAAAMSDRWGRKPFLLGYETLYVLSCAAATVDGSATVIAAAAVVGSFGRGANGSAGPFGAIENAWLTQGVRDDRRLTHVLGLNSSLGFVGMALGAALGALPGLGHHGEPIPPASYGVIFPLALTFALACLACVALARDRYALETAPTAPDEERSRRRDENRNLRHLGLVNLLQGAGIGLSGPLVSYWFAVRFGLGPAQIAPLMAGGFVAAALSAQLGTRLSARHGLMGTIVPLRATALLALTLMPLAPSPTWAMAAYLLNKTLNRSTNGLRATVTAKLVRNHRRGFAGAVTAISRQIPRSAGPIAAGLLMDAGWLATPFLLGATLQAAYLYLYQARFRAATSPEASPART
ncbi:major facilitator superfamily protein [mine drainage metagenome]|jgi:MFS family permease|uniref:Major facilitator superfamily protein n=1 Tax=mine drainage metagenome TaxID=410659 RepID=A0A1J5QZB6_9ZZZZ